MSQQYAITTVTSWTQLITRWHVIDRTRKNGGHLAGGYLIGKGSSRILISSLDPSSSFISSGLASNTPPIMDDKSASEYLKSSISMLQERCKVDISTVLVSPSSADHYVKHLRDGQTVSIPGTESDHLLVIAAPKSHGLGSYAFALTSEDVLFPGHTIATNYQLLDLQHPAASTITDMDVYFKFGKKLLNMPSLPRLIAPTFPQEEMITSGSSTVIQKALDFQRQSQAFILSQIKAHPGISTSGIIDAYLRKFAATFPALSSREQLIIDGNVKAHLICLRNSGSVTRESGRASPSQDPSKIYGPGGLSMTQIFAKVQEARKRDGHAIPPSRKEPNQRDKVLTLADLNLSDQWS